MPLSRFLLMMMFAMLILLQFVEVKLRTAWQTAFEWLEMSRHTI